MPLNKNNYDDELNPIKYIASGNGYRCNIIDKLIKKQKTNNYKKLYEENQNNRFVSTEYNEWIYNSLKR